MTDQIRSEVSVEQRLRESEARLHLLTEASSDSLHRTSPDWGEMTEFNRQPFLAVQLLGLLAVGRNAVMAKQDVEPPIAEPPAMLRQLAYGRMLLQASLRLDVTPVPADATR